VQGAGSSSYHFGDSPCHAERQIRDQAHPGDRHVPSADRTRRFRLKGGVNGNSSRCHRERIAGRIPELAGEKNSRSLLGVLAARRKYSLKINEEAPDADVRKLIFD
jgi:hypothetical protein